MKSSCNSSARVMMIPTRRTLSSKRRRDVVRFHVCQSRQKWGTQHWASKVEHECSSWSYASPVMLPRFRCEPPAGEWCSNFRGGVRVGRLAPILSVRDALIKSASEEQVSRLRRIAPQRGNSTALEMTELSFNQSSLRIGQTSDIVHRALSITHCSSGIIQSRQDWPEHIGYKHPDCVDGC
jgi:hypothetical protein